MAITWHFRSILFFSVAKLHYLFDTTNFFIIFIVYVHPQNNEGMGCQRKMYDRMVLWVQTAYSHQRQRRYHTIAVLFGQRGRLCIAERQAIHRKAFRKVLCGQGISARIYLRTCSWMTYN